MKKIVLLLTVLLVLASLFSCQQSDVNPNEEDSSKDSGEATPVAEDISVITLKGPTGMGMAKLMEDSETKGTFDTYRFTIASAPEEVQAEIIKGNFDIAAVPVNLAAALYQKTNGELKIAGINTLGVLYILENGNSVQTISDLRGKTIYASGQGATPEYSLRYILKQNGIDPDKDVTIEYVAQHAELATMMVANKASIALLPEPNVSAVLAGNKQVRIALDLTQEWKKSTGEQEDMIQGCIVVNKDFAENHTDALVRFLNDYKNSVDYVNTNENAAELIVKFGIIPKLEIAKSAIPNSNICLIEGEEMQNKVEHFLKVLFDANPKSVGGKMPSEDFYFKK